MLNTEAGKTARQIYEELYKPGRYKSLWFRWQGKPLMICDPKDADAELLQLLKELEAAKSLAEVL